LWSLDDEAKSAWMENLIAKLGAPRHQTDSQLMLQWDHIQEMGKYGIDFGSHTLTHPILSRVTLEQARREIEKSKDAIEAKLNIKVKHFAYPVGRRVDFNSEIKHLLSAVGYESAVTTLAGSNDPNRDRFELRRATPWDDDIDSFTLRLSYFKFAS
jgi:peptidoglycan/xylan/chitin deacetylase (PgdA/CDA1 family)